MVSGDLSTPQMILGLTNKLAVAGAFSVLYIYTAEVFPTQLRLVALGGSSLFARVGAILSPFVPLLVSRCRPTNIIVKLICQEIRIKPVLLHKT